MAGEVVLIDPQTGLSYKAGGGGTGTGANQVQGTGAAGAADDGSNPVKIAAVYTTAPPTYTNGQRAGLFADVRGNLKTTLLASDGVSNLGLIRAQNADTQDPNIGALLVSSVNFYYNGTTSDRMRGDVTGAWVHAAPNTVSSALSGTLATSGATAAVTFIATARQEVINPSAGVLWASWGTPAVNGAGSFPIAAGGTFTTDRTAGTLTLLSTAATQPYTVNRYS